MLMLRQTYRPSHPHWSQSASRTLLDIPAQVGKVGGEMEGAIVIMTHHFLVSRWLDRGPRPVLWSARRIWGYGKSGGGGALPRPGAPGPPSVFPTPRTGPGRATTWQPAASYSLWNGCRLCRSFCPAGRPVPWARRAWAPPQTVLGPWGPGPPLGRDIRPPRPVLRPGGFHSIRLFLPVNGKQSLTGLLSAGKML